MNLNTGIQKLIGAASQYATGDAKNSSDMPVRDQSPISAALDDIDTQLRYAHEHFSMLENRVDPIRASRLDASSESSPASIAHTQIEQRLQNIHDLLRHLSVRISNVTDELRI